MHEDGAVSGHSRARQSDISQPPTSGGTARRPYRPEIDGLRAISVLAVLLFHAHVPRFAGGFAGVDVFFVISGLLITQIVLDESGSGTFSFARFYERRARRILPALFAMLAAACLAALILLPGALARFCESVVAVVGFCSNILFWYQQRRYFAPATESLPLLHTWSLGIEEQFYLLFPAALVFVQRAGKQAVIPAIAAIALASFAYSLWAASHDPIAAFFSPAARVWELMLGALLATGIAKLPARQWLGDAACAAGLAAIACAICLPAARALPNGAVMLACFGAALLLHGAQAPDSFFARALSIRPLVAIGKASYSLYLWHWPMIMFGTYYIFDPWTSQIVRVACALAAIPVAYLSWRFIEQPFRGRQGVWPRRKIFIRALAAGAVFIALGGAGVLLNGVPQRFGRAVHHVIAAGIAPPSPRCGGRHRQNIGDGSACLIGDLSKPRSFILWGDSHASMYGAALDALARHYGVGGTVAILIQCPPLLQTEPQTDPVSKSCSRRNENVLRYIEQTRPAAVILAARWGFRAEGADPFDLADDDRDRVDRNTKVENAFAISLAATVARLATAHVAVYFVSDVVEAPFDVADRLAKAQVLGVAVDASIARREYARQMATVTAAVAVLRNRGLLKTIDPEDILCDAARCRMADHGLPLYRDSSHLSKTGAEIAAPAFESLMKSLGAKAPEPVPHP